jgi:hypothetical protein
LRANLVAYFPQGVGQFSYAFTAPTQGRFRVSSGERINQSVQV